VQPWPQDLLGVTACFCLCAPIKRLAGFDPLRTLYEAPSHRQLLGAAVIHTIESADKLSAFLDGLGVPVNVDQHRDVYLRVRRHGAIAPDPLLRISFHQSRQALVSGSKQPDDGPIPQ
jgi:hypothetical protein